MPMSARIEKSSMRIARTRSSIETAPREIKEIAAEVARRVGHQPIAMGLLTVYLPHTSAALLIQENASPCAISCRATHPLVGLVAHPRGDIMANFVEASAFPWSTGNAAKGLLPGHRATPHPGVSHWWCGRPRSKFPRQLNREINPVNKEIKLPIRELNRSNTEGGHQHGSRHRHVSPARILGSCVAIAFESCEEPRSG